MAANSGTGNVPRFHESLEPNKSWYLLTKQFCCNKALIKIKFQDEVSAVSPNELKNETIVVKLGKWFKLTMSNLEKPTRVPSTWSIIIILSHFHPSYLPQTSKFENPYDNPYMCRSNSESYGAPQKTQNSLTAAVTAMARATNKVLAHTQKKKQDTLQRLVDRNDGRNCFHHTELSWHTNLCTVKQLKRFAQRLRCAVQQHYHNRSFGLFVWWPLQT